MPDTNNLQNFAKLTSDLINFFYDDGIVSRNERKYLCSSHKEKIKNLYEKAGTVKDHFQAKGALDVSSAANFNTVVQLSVEIVKNERELAIVDNLVKEMDFIPNQQKDRKNRENLFLGLLDGLDKSLSDLSQELGIIQPKKPIAIEPGTSELSFYKQPTEKRNSRGENKVEIEPMAPVSNTKGADYSKVIIKTEKLIEQLKKEIDSRWPYPNKDVKQAKVDALTQILSAMKETPAMVGLTLVLIKENFPQAISGSTSHRTAELINEIANIEELHNSNSQKKGPKPN